MSASTYPRTSFVLPQSSSFNQIREKERFELSTLNDKFADYVEKVRYLEAQNKKIQMDTNILTEKQDENYQKFKLLFEREISLLKEQAENLFKEKNTIFSNSQDTQNSIPELKQHLNQIFKDDDTSKYETELIEQQLSSIEGDILMYKRRLSYQDNEYNQWKQFHNHIQRLLLQIKNEIHNENLTRSSSEQTIKQLQFDINRLREQQKQKLQDLKQSTPFLTINITNDRAHLFQSELSNIIRRIRQDFDKQNDLHRNELYGQFTHSYDELSREYPELGYLFNNEHEQERIKQEEERIRSELQRIRTDSQLIKQKNAELKLHIRELEINLEMSIEENQRIQKLQQNNINEYKLKHDQINQEYDEVILKQTTLEKEIETYRNLLEGTMKPVIDHITNEYNIHSNNQIKIEQQSTIFNSINNQEINNFISFNNNNNNQLIDSKISSHDNPIEINVNDNNDLDTIDTNEIMNNSSSSNIRFPIILQTRRNN